MTLTIGPSGTYRTLEEAITKAPAGAVVVVEDGRHERPRSAIARPLTLVSRTVGGATIDYGPQCRTAPDSGAWQRVTLTGPGLRGAPAGAKYALWKSANTTARAGTRAPTNLAYARTLDETPQRIAHWATDAADLATPEGWAEKLFTNLSHNYGWASFRNPDGTIDLYARIQGDRNPNDYHVTAGELPTSSTGSSASLLTIAGRDVRLCGFRFRQGPVTLTHQAFDAVLDQFTAEMAYVKLNGSKGTPSQYGAGHLIERFTMRDTSLYSTDPQEPPIAWDFIKGGITNADGTRYGSKIGGNAERTAIWNGGGAHHVTVRHGDIGGYFNGIGGSGSGYDRHSARGMAVYDVRLHHIADDALEPEHNVICFKAWDFRIERATVALSVGPLSYGPAYLVDGVAWDLGPAGTRAANPGDPLASGPSGKGVKFSGDSVPTGRVYLVNQTWWTDQPGVSGLEQSASSGSSQEAFCVRNSILRFTKYAAEVPGGVRWDERGNHFATTDAGRGLSVAQQRYADPAEYRRRSGQGQGTNAHAPFTDAAWLDAQLVDPRNGDLRVRPGSPLEGLGAG